MTNFKLTSESNSKAGVVNASIDIADVPAIPGLVFRRFRGPQEYPLMAGVINSANMVDGVEEVEGVEEVANLYDQLTNCDPYTDMLFAEIDGEMVSFSRVWWRIDGEGNRVYWHLAYLKPPWRRRGIGRVLLHWNERRLQQIAVDHDSSTPAYFQAFIQDTALGANALLKQEGYTPVRYFHFMQRRGLEDLPEAPLPAGIELRPVQPEHLRLIWETKEEAFQDHWGFAPGSESDYRRWVSDPTHDFSLWLVAWQDTQVVGTSINVIFPEDNARYGFLRGEIHTVGVRRPWRGCGLGRALIVESLRVLRARGMTEAVLGVDSDSLTGALRLYVSVGFRTIAQDMVMRKPFACIRDDPQENRTK